MILPKIDNQGKYYLSYSQTNTWKRSKREYIRQYFFNESFLGNDYTDFGSMIGEALENNNFKNFSKKEQLFLKTIPRYDQFEREIRLNFNDFYIKGFIDTNTLVYKEENGVKKEVVTSIADYKTGNIDKKRSEYESSDYNQLAIYSAAIRQETGISPENVSVFLIERLGNAFAGEKLTLGDSFVTIDKKISDKELDEVMNNVEKTAKEISDYYTIFLELSKL